ncbi:hypothetical protein [Arthrobacter sp. SAFR-014]|uniref:hypothetical protein n=1 Tax=unclassified Arthrobacter TaxID=235627 RepID=UPI003F7CAA15
MESFRMEIEARDCAECGKPTPHEVHYLVDRSLSGVTRREVGSGCTRCAEATEG